MDFCLRGGLKSSLLWLRELLLLCFVVIPWSPRVLLQLLPLLLELSFLLLLELCLWLCWWSRPSVSLLLLLLLALFGLLPLGVLECVLRLFQW